MAHDLILSLAFLKPLTNTNSHWCQNS